MEEGYSTFISQFNSALEKYPDFDVISENGEKFLRGNLEIVDEDGKFWESYLVEIKYKEGFPYQFPKVFEVSNKIPKIVDWHIYKGGSCCIDVLPSEIIKCKDGITLISFIESELLPYLFNQTHRKVEGYYVNEGYSHGLATGMYEFYSKKLGTGSNVKKTLDLIYYIANNSRLNRSNKCFCGSNDLFRKCHMEAFDELKKIGKKLLLKHIGIIYQRSGIKDYDRFIREHPNHSS
jgi:hypothetical protein